MDSRRPSLGPVYRGCYTPSDRLKRNGVTGAGWSCQEKRAVGFADIKDAANVRMRNLPGVAHLGVKPLERRGVLGKPLGEKFHRDDLPKGQVFSAKNFAHSASANQCNYAVALREDLPGREPAAADGVGTGQWIRNEIGRAHV